MLSHPNEIFILHQGYWSGWKNKNKQNNVGKTWLFCCMSSQMIFSDNFDIWHFWWSKLWKGHEWNLLGPKEQRKKYTQRYTIHSIMTLVVEYQFWLKLGSILPKDQAERNLIYFLKMRNVDWLIKRFSQLTSKQFCISFVWLCSQRKVSQ